MDDPHFLTVAPVATAVATDGFSQRNATVLAGLGRLGRVTSITYGAIGSGADVEVDADTFRLDRSGKLDRLEALMGRGPKRHRLGRLLAARAQDCGATAVLGLTYQQPEVLCEVSRRLPTIWFAEEEAKSFGYGPRLELSAVQRTTKRLEGRVLRHGLRHLAGVVVITGGEVDRAAERTKRPVVVVPHALDLDRWNGATSTGPRRGVLVVGNYAERRNAEGLVEVLGALEVQGGQAPLSVTVVSGVPPARGVLEAVSSHVHVVGPLEDLRPLYAEAAVTLVPAFKVWGAKTTVLQGWATGCPVVATDAAARSVGGVDGVHLRSGATPEAVAAAVLEVAADPVLGTRLAEAGAAHLAAAHSIAAVTRQLELVCGLLDQWRTP